MKIALTNQHRRLASFLPTFSARALSYADPSLFPEHRTTVAIPTARNITDLRACNIEYFFSYDIFPPHILSALGEWQLEGRGMRIGDVIIQQASVPPIPICVKFIFAVRVLAILKSQTEMSFTYGTLAGHVETGTSEFILTLGNAGISAEIHTFSQPAHLAGRLIAPVVTRPYQRYCTSQALAHIRNSFLHANPEGCCQRSNLPWRVVTYGVYDVARNKGSSKSGRES